MNNKQIIILLAVSLIYCVYTLAGSAGSIDMEGDEYRDNTVYSSGSENQVSANIKLTFVLTESLIYELFLRKCKSNTDCINGGLK